MGSCEINTAGGAVFWFTIMTTLGFGNTAPITEGGRAMVYTLGFVCILVFTAIIGQAGCVTRPTLPAVLRCTRVSSCHGSTPALSRSPLWQRGGGACGGGIWVLCVTIRACLAMQRCCGLPLPYACRHIALAVFDDMFHRLGLPCLTHGWHAVLLWLCTLYLWMLGLAGIYIQWKQDRVPGEVSAHTRARVCVHECVGCGGLLQVQPARSSLAGPLCLLVVDVGGCTRVFSSPHCCGNHAMGAAECWHVRCRTVRCRSRTRSGSRSFRRRLSGLVTTT